MDIQEIIKRYANHPERKHLQTCRGAFDKCRKESVNLWEHLTDLKVMCSIASLKGYKGILHNPHRMWLNLPQDCWRHYMVFVDGFYYDLTMRQFNSECNYPAIFNEEQIQKNWMTVNLI